MSPPVFTQSGGVKLTVGSVDGTAPSVNSPFEDRFPSIANAIADHANEHAIGYIAWARIDTTSAAVEGWDVIRDSISRPQYLAWLPGSCCESSSATWSTSVAIKLSRASAVPFELMFGRAANYSRQTASARSSVDVSKHLLFSIVFRDLGHGLCDLLFAELILHYVERCSG